MRTNPHQPAHGTFSVDGGCLCGGFRYTLRAEPTGLGDCHCVDCRRSSGAPFVTWGTVPRPAFQVLHGTLRRVPFAARVRGFAACCGTHLLFEDAADSPTVDIAIATLDEPSRFPPRKAIWTEDKLPWVTLNPALPAFPQRG